MDDYAQPYGPPGLAPPRTTGMAIAALACGIGGFFVFPASFAAVVLGHIAPGDPVTPTGTVTVRSGNKVVCVITLNKDGTGTCTAGTAGYPPACASQTRRSACCRT